MYPNTPNHALSNVSDRTVRVRPLWEKRSGAVHGGQSLEEAADDPTASVIAFQLRDS